MPHGDKPRGRRQLRVETLEDRRLLSIQAVSAAVSTQVGDTAGGLNLGDWAWVSQSGRYVAFTSDAPNLVANQVDAQRGAYVWNPEWNSNADVFLRDTQTGTTTLVSAQAGAATPTTANGMSIALGISDDGRFVLFGSAATNLVASQTDSNDAFDIFLYDASNGSTQLVSHSTSGLTRAGNGESSSAALSADGKFVAFTSDSSNLASSDTNSASDVFLFEQATGTVTLVSRSGVTGASGNKASSLPSVYSGGTTVAVAFVSEATNLISGVTDANGKSDVFLFDYTVATGTGTTSLVSRSALSATNTATGGASTNPAISAADGLYVAYESAATNLVDMQSDSNSASDIFLFSRVGGVSENRLVSAAGGSGATTGSGASTSPVISGDGRYVAFLSRAGNLVAGQAEANSGNDVFLFDRDSTGGSSLTLVSHAAGSATTTAAGESSSLSMSDDGSSIAFASQASDLVAPLDDGNNGTDVFVYHRDLGTSQLVSHGSASSAVTGNDKSRVPAISGDGLSVVYLSDATDLVAGKKDYNEFPDLVRGSHAGAAAAWTNTLVTLRDPGMAPATGNSLSYVMPASGQSVSSADGRYVVFTSKSSNLVAGQETNAQESVFLLDAVTGEVQLVSHSSGSATTTGNDSSVSPTISADGRYVAFVSKADDLVENQSDANGLDDVFLFDRLTGEIRLVSGAAGSAVNTGNDASVSPAISADGRFIAFASDATNLVSGMTHTTGEYYVPLRDVFLYDAVDGSIRLLSVSSANPSVTANGDSTDPSISADGSRVVFLSTATDLVGGQVDGDSTRDVFLFDSAASGSAVQMVSRVQGTTATAGNGEAASPVLSADGRFVAFESLATNLVGDASHDTNGGSDVFLYDVSGQSLQLVSHARGTTTTAADGASTSPSISADGSYVAFASYATNLFDGQDDTNHSADIFLYDASANRVQLVSHTAGTAQTSANAYSAAPVLSADGRFLAYRSMATDLVAGVADANQSSDVFRFDRLAGESQLVSSTAASATTAGDSRSLLPSISGDGRSVVFESDATNLIAGDFNRAMDVFLFRDGGLANQAPSLNTGVATVFDPIVQDAVSNPGTAVDDLVGTAGLYSDPDGGPVTGIAVTGQDTTGCAGTWWYSTDGGVNWTAFTSPAATSATLLAADGAGLNRIRFVPAAGKNGTASLSFRAWDGSDGNLNGTTGVNVTVASTAYSSQTETATITVDPPDDSVAPTASLTAAKVNAASNATAYTFTVTYTDNVAVSVSTIGAGDVLVTGPNGFSQAATFVSVNVGSDGTPRTATYRITPPGGTWDSADTGTYTVTMQAGQVTDLKGNPVAAGSLGTFAVDTVAPTASLAASNVTNAGATSYTFTVTYSDNVAVKVSTLSTGDVVVTGPGSFSQAATLVSVNAGSDGTPRTATYRITPPGGTWDAADTGTYTVTMQANQVTDANGNAVASGSLGTFQVDTVAPTASLTASNVTVAGGTEYAFTVTYSDNVAVKYSTLTNGDVLVTGPNGFSQAATLASVNVGSDGTPRTATYTITPPGGVWDSPDKGTYTVTMQANAVTDTLGNAVTAGSLGTFTVSPAADKTSPTAALDAKDVLTNGATTYTFTVTYTDNVAIDVATLDNFDVKVTGPNKFSQLATLVGVDRNSNGSPRTATYSITPSGGAWSPANNGVYTVSMQSNQVKDTSGKTVKSGKLGTFTVDAVNPTATLAASNVTKNGGKTYTFTVTYSDNIAVDVSTLGSSDILVTGPGGFSQLAKYVKASSSKDGTPRKVTYQITPSGGAWSEANNGIYTIALLNGEVTDTAGHAVASGVLGTFTVDSVVPTATLAAENVATEGGTTYTFTVTYADNLGMSIATLDNRDIKVTGKGFSQYATLVGVDLNSDGTPRTATYQITPKGGAWNAKNNGTYTVSMQSKQVQDLGGNVVKSGKLGTFTVDTVAPTAAALSASKVTKAGGTSYSFTVTYKDNLGVDVSTLEGLGVVVTDPNGLNVPVTLSKLSSRTNGTSRTGTYLITPPGGSWDSADNGTYTVSVVADQTMDLLQNSVAGGVLGTFTVSVPGTAAAKATTMGASSTAATSLNSATLAAATDAALASVGPQREDAVATTAWESLGDWLWA